MTNTEKEYISARQAFSQALRNENASKAVTVSARYRLMLAREELRAEERDLLTNNVVVH